MSDQVRHAVSDGSCAAHAGPCPAPRTPIPHTKFGIRKPGIRNPRAPSMERHPASMERSRTFFPSPALFLLTTEHGAVLCVPT